MRKSKKIAVATATSVALIGGGVAYAYWTTSGSGEGTGSTTAGVTNHLSFDQDALTAMYPGDSSQPLSVTVTNSDPSEAAYVTTVKAFITTDKAGCTGDDFKLGGTSGHKDSASAQTLSWTAQDLPVSGHADATSTIQFNNTGDNQDACKGAVVTVHYLAS